MIPLFLILRYSFNCEYYLIFITSAHWSLYVLEGPRVQLTWTFSVLHSGLGHLVAKNEDDYVKLALQLASDITALSNLRMDLRRLMSKSPLCDGSKFTLGLESSYRNMWRRYCKGDVPSLKRMESSEEPSERFSEPTKTITSRESPLGSVKTNGFNVVPNPMLDLSSCEENGAQLTQPTNSGKLSWNWLWQMSLWGIYGGILGSVPHWNLGFCIIYSNWGLICWSWGYS